MGDLIRLDYGALLRRGFGVWKDATLTLGLATLVAMLVVGVPAWLLAWPFSSLGWQGFMRGIAYTLLGGPMMAGFLGMVLQVFDRPLSKPVVSDVFRGFGWFVPALLLSLTNMGVGLVFGLLGLIPFVGPVIHLVLSLAWSTATIFAFFFLVDLRLPVIEALAASVQAVVRSFVSYLLLVLMTAAIAVGPVMALGMVAPLGGLAVVFSLVACASVPLAACILAAAYRELQPPRSDGAADQA